MLIIRYIIIGLQFLLLVGAYVLNRLASTKMGLMRHLVMLNNKWRATFNLELTFAILALLLIALGLWQILSLRRHHLCRHISHWVMLVLLAFLFLLYISLTLNKGLRANILLLPILGVVPILQYLQCIIISKKGR